MKIIFNGKETQIAEQSTVSQVLEQFGLANKKFAVIVNGQLRKDNPELQTEDRLDLISFIGGG